MKYLGLILVSFLILSCKQVPQAQDTADGQSFGEVITNDDAISYDEFYRQMMNQDSVKTKIKATVLEVCQAKGCWMTLSSDNLGEEKSVFVKFKDYGFFVPKDISGRQVVIEGTAYREVTSVDELRHYAEDKGASKEEIAEITKPEEELKFMATGVLLLDK